MSEEDNNENSSASNSGSTGAGTSGTIDSDNYSYDFWRDKLINYMNGRTDPKTFPTAEQTVRDIRMVKTKNPTQYDLETAAERLKRIMREIRYYDPRFNIWTDYNNDQGQWTLVNASDTNDNIYWMRNRGRRAAKTCSANRRQVWVFVEHLQAYKEDHPDEANEIDNIVNQIIGEANQGLRL